MKINFLNTNVDDNLYLFRMKQAVKNRFVIINSFIYFGWLVGIWYLTKGKKALYKPISHSDIMFNAKNLVTKNSPGTNKLIFNETVLGGKFGDKAIFDIQFGGNKIYGTATFEADLINNQWVFKKAVANYNVEQRSNVQHISKSLLSDN